MMACARTGMIATCVLFSTALTSTGFTCVPDPAAERPIAFISDLHMSFGRGLDGEWDRYEDFRWPVALGGLLEHLRGWGEGRAELVIVGDLLELWQPRDRTICQGQGPELGCRPDELVGLTRDVIKGHPEVFEMLGTWSREGEHRLTLVPGNHDAALLLPSVQELVLEALGGQNGRVRVATSGIWTSPDCQLHAEHGQQIPLDPNLYTNWPQIEDAATGFVVRPWGEWFVQQMFNKVERAYSLIDNLSPEITGAWYRIGDRGYWTVASDVAEFIRVGFIQTSWAQRGQWVGAPRGGSPDWNVEKARDLGHLLFARALPEDDEVRKLLLEEPADEHVEALRDELDRIAKDAVTAPNELVRELCTRIATLNTPENNTAINSCRPARAGLLVSKVPGVREAAFARHLSRRRDGNSRLTHFVYGHTHQLEAPHAVRIDERHPAEVTVLNTGAFQRVVDSATYGRVLEQKSRELRRTITPGEGLRELQPEDLPPCYTVALAVPQGLGWKVSLHRWHMAEDSSGAGLIPVGGEKERRLCWLR